MSSSAIDAHQHFWKYRPEEYAWIGDGMDILRRDFLPEDLAPELWANGVGGAISVQARHSVEESDWLLDLADRHDYLRGVVGWAPLAEAVVEGALERLSGRAKLVGIRHILHEEPDDYLLRADFNAGISLLDRFHLTYDILIFERQLPTAIQFVDRHPNQVFVLDHAAKPRIRERAVSSWRANITELARRENVYCKLSGMVTEADWTRWTPADLEPYWNAVLEAFGPRRLMFGSDWPVLLPAGAYARWRDTAYSFMAGLSEDEQEWIMGKTTAQAYRLRPLA